MEHNLLYWKITELAIIDIIVIVCFFVGFAFAARVRYRWCLLEPSSTSMQFGFGESQLFGIPGEGFNVDFFWWTKNNRELCHVHSMWLVVCECVGIIICVYIFLV